MRQLSFIALFGTLAILMGGCGGGETETATTPAATTPAATTPAATTPATEATPQQSPTQPFSSPMVDPKQPQKPTPGATAATPTPTIIVTAPPELTSPTNPDQRTAQVQKEIEKANRDPFGLPPLELNPQQPNPNANRTPTQKPNRSVPTVEGVPAAQPPIVSVPKTPTTSTNRNIPTVDGVPSAQAPVVSLPRRVTSPPTAVVSVPRRVTSPPTGATTSGRTIPQAPLASVPNSPGITLRIRRVGTPTTRTTRQPQTIQVARAPQRTQQPARTVTRAPQTTQRPTTRTAQKPRTTQQPRTIAAAPKPAPTPAIVAPPAPPQIPTLPPPPDPILAKAVEVSGVVVVGTEPQAIVKAPNEANSRYVRAGQRLANGQVLVKRIEFNEGSEPIVILEQNGVEVAKVVGEKPPAPTQSGAQAVNPILVTPKRETNV